MKSSDLESMSVDELWSLHQRILQILPQKLANEKARLEQRLHQLRSGSDTETKKERRRYPPVYPKYKNPRNPSETWSGRGKQPKWLAEYLKSGRKLDDFLIK